MQTNQFTYQLIEGKPSKELLEEILVLYQELFEDYNLSFFKERISLKEDLLLIRCLHNKNLVGFKIGYRYNETTFYSWVGGVQANYRRQGIGTKLAQLQTQKVVDLGYRKLRTKSMNRFKPMLILNLKNGFDIVQVYTNESGQTKIVFEKLLNH